MALESCLEENKKTGKSKHRLFHQCRPLQMLLLVVLVLVLVSVTTVSSWFAFSPRGYGRNSFTTLRLDTPLVSENKKLRPPNPNNETRHHYNSSSSSSSSSSSQSGRYHNWQVFSADFEEMMRNFKIYVYPHVYNNASKEAFAGIFLPHPNPLDPRLGNYLSEHMFKLSILRSSLITVIPQEAHFFFLPFSVNAMRNEPRIRSEAAIAEFVAQYTRGISSQFPFWNASAGADHFYVCCHSVGRDAASKHVDLLNNAVQVTCSSSYFQKSYVSHKDVPLPQVWPRPHHVPLNPPHARHRLVYFSGRIQNSRVRQELIASWGNDTSMDVFDKSPSYPYEEGFRRSKYCLHVKGYEVNTARVSDAIHYGCIPVILSNYYDLPFSNVLDWSKFSVVINTGEIPFLKKRLLSITRQMYLSMYHNLCQVRRHFVWHKTPRGFDSFYMTAYQLWLRRSVNRVSY